MPLRFFVSTVLAVLAVCAATASAATQSPSGIAPSLIHRGQHTTLTAKTSGSAPCTALLRYADGKVQSVANRRPRNHRVTFVIRVPLDSAIGAGHWNVLCGAAVTSGSFVVIAAKSTAGNATPRVVVDRQGFSQRSDRSGTGSLLSYGLLLRNTSTSEDAHNVYVIVNMVASSGELIGSKSRTLALLPAGGTFALGDSLNLRTQVPATRLEITIRVGAHEPKKAHPMPDFANVRILPSSFDPGWVAEVDGEIVNDTTPLTLSSANISIVVLDGAGNPIGGGSGFTVAALPSGSRFVFVAQIGFTAIPLDRAATEIISAEPTYVAAS